MTQNEINELRILAQGDIARAAAFGVDLNPYSTDGARSCWQAGFDGVVLTHAQNTQPRAWERGRQARMLTDASKAA